MIILCKSETKCWTGLSVLLIQTRFLIKVPVLVFLAKQSSVLFQYHFVTNFLQCIEFDTCTCMFFIYYFNINIYVYIYIASMIIYIKLHLTNLMKLILMLESVILKTFALQYAGNYLKELKKAMSNPLGNIGMFLEYGSKKVLK